MTPRTKKAAREAGYLTYGEALPKHLVPRRDAEPTMVEDVGFLHDQCEEVISKTEARNRRLRVPVTAKPVTTFDAKIQGRKWIEYAVYRLSDCVPMRAVSRDVPPVQIDLLKAIFTANKAAKRYRDGAALLSPRSTWVRWMAQGKRRKDYTL